MEEPIHHFDLKTFTTDLLFKQIEENYGRIVLQEARKLVSIFIAIEKQFSHLQFNHACKTNGILPKSLQFSHPLEHIKDTDWLIVSVGNF